MGETRKKSLSELFQGSLEYYESGQLEKAVELLKEYLAINPDSDTANYNLGLFLSDLWLIDDAEIFLQKALQLNPEFIRCYSVLGNNFIKQSRFDEAEICYRKALKIDPEDVNNHFNLAFLLLLQGRYEEGWPEYRWRLKHSDYHSNPHSSKEWTGQSLKNKSLLLLAEQGMGDIIQCLRFIKRIKQKGTLVAVETHAPLIPLLNACQEIDLIIQKGAPLPKTDYHIPIMGILAVIQEKEADFSLNYPYLQVKQSSYETWKKRLATSKKLRIGISWQGNPDVKTDKRRSIPLIEFAKLAELEDVELISLQKGEAGTSQMPGFIDKYALTNLDDMSDSDRDLMDTAAVMANMDLIISSDNGLIHLAGALGIPSWVLLSTAADWRWLLDRSDSPWYPSLKVFRQKETGNWSELFGRVQQEVKKNVNELKLQKPNCGTYDDSQQQFILPWYQEAAELYQKGEFDSCKKLCKKILAIEPRHFKTNELLAMTYSVAKKYKKTLEHLKRVILMNPQYVQALSNCGLTLYHLKKFKKAEAMLKTAIQLDETKDSAYHNLGLVLLDQSRFKEAESYLRQAIKLNPDYAESYYLLSIALYKMGDIEEGIELIKHAIELSPSTENYFAVLTTLYLKQEGIEDYEEPLTELLNINSESKNVHIGIGIVLSDKGKYEESVASFRKAIDIDPEFAVAYHNLGHSLSELHRFEEAEKAYRKTLELAPFFIMAHFNLATLLLKKGLFSEGWQEYRWRSKFKSHKMSEHDSPEWAGEDLSNKSIVIISEQGYGDMLQTVRYLKRIKQKNTKIILESHQLLVPLFSSLPEIDQIILRGEKLPPADFHIPIFNIPAVLQDDIKDFSTENSYLKASPEAIEEWRQRLGQKSRFRIGIVWQGNPKFKKDKWRAIPLEEFSKIASLKQVELISLQKGEAGTSQIPDFKKHFELVDVDKHLHKDRDFMDTAGIMLNLDLLISSDTSVVHLAGALGVPAWVLLNVNADWRWLLDREDSPWYPSLRLFRQKELGDWKSVFTDVQAELQKLLS